MFPQVGVHPSTNSWEIEHLDYHYCHMGGTPNSAINRWIY